MEGLFLGIGWTRMGYRSYRQIGSSHSKACKATAMCPPFRPPRREPEMSVGPDHGDGGLCFLKEIELPELTWLFHVISTSFSRLDPFGKLVTSRDWLVGFRRDLHWTSHDMNRNCISSCHVFAELLYAYVCVCVCVETVIANGQWFDLSIWFRNISRGWMHGLAVIHQRRHCLSMVISIWDARSTYLLQFI